VELLVIRRPTWLDTTPGKLYLDGTFFCFVLEDRVRELSTPVETWKVPGKTAIPQGRYPLVLEDSPKFGPQTLTVANVPGFSYIRIHAGNTDENTEGCLLVGQTFLEAADDGGDVLNSRVALDQLKAKVVPAIQRGEPTFITVVSA
jgi:hypothetical protein